MKSFYERKVSLAVEKVVRNSFSPLRTYIDRTSHFFTPHSGENQLSKPELHFNLRFTFLIDKSRWDKAASVRVIDACPALAC